MILQSKKAIVSLIVVGLVQVLAKVIDVPEDFPAAIEPVVGALVAAVAVYFARNKPAAG